MHQLAASFINLLNSYLQSKHEEVNHITKPGILPIIPVLMIHGYANFSGVLSYPS